MRKRIVLLMMVALMLLAIPAFAGPGDGGTEIIPYNGGEGVNTTPGRPFPGTETTTPAFNNNHNGISIVVDGVVLRPDVSPYVDHNNRTQVPFRAIGEALNCQVNWVAAGNKVVVEKANLKVVMVIGQKTFTVNGQVKTMDTVPVITKSRTFIPVRYIAEALNCNVNWNSSTKTVEITSK